MSTPAGTFPNKTLRGIRDTIPSGYYLGRASTGNGPVELIGGKILAQGVDQALAAAGGGLVVQSIQTSGPGITNTVGTFSVEWNAGTVNAIAGPGITIVAGTSTSPGTLEVEWNAGSVGAIGVGLSINSGGTLLATALPAEWNAGTVNALGTTASGTLAISGTTLNVTTPNEWTAGTVTTLANLFISSDTLYATAPFTSWNPLDVATGAGTYPPNLTNGNLMLTGQVSSAASAIRAGNAQGTGKFYWEHLITAVGGFSPAPGLVETSESLAAFAATSADWPGGIVWLSTGAVYLNGALFGSSAANTYANGNTIAIAVDLGAQLIWFRVGAAGNWNNSGTANPATGAGGISFSALTGTYNPVMWMNEFGGAASVTTSNFGALPFVGAVPSGFTAGWPSFVISSEWTAGTVVAVGAGLTISSGTILSTVVAGLTHAQVMARVNVGFR